MLQLSLTCDDAPTISAGAPYTRRDPLRMDRLRETLQQRGVRHCVAFVVGAEANERGLLERWLRAGYELGNHTWGHEAASQTSETKFLESARRCHELLLDVGAWPEGTTRWFRFPYLDYGANADQRTRIRKALAELGYEMAHATVDLFDDRFETALGSALLEQERGTGASRTSALRTRLIQSRFQHAAETSLKVARTGFGRTVPQIPYFHFGATSDLFLDSILDGWTQEDARFCSLDEALAHPALQRDEGTGLLRPAQDGTLLARLGRVAQRLGNRLDPSRGDWLGPPWPRQR